MRVFLRLFDEEIFLFVLPINVEVAAVMIMSGPLVSPKVTALRTLLCSVKCEDELRCCAFAVHSYLRVKSEVVILVKPGFSSSVLCLFQPAARGIFLPQCPTSYNTILSHA